MFGRTLELRRSAGGAAWFRFEELCAQPLGPADYIAVASRFHTVYLSGIPAMSMLVRARGGGGQAGRSAPRGRLGGPRHPA
jgi:predicted ATPase